MLDSEGWHIHDHHQIIVIASIRDNATGEIREYETEEFIGTRDKEPITYNWEEGNYSCDCNRKLFFERAKDKEAKFDMNSGCTDGKYSVSLRVKEGGLIYYKEFE
jgi:hypothetical protein